MIEVVIPAHNAAAFLRETLDSIAAQTLPPALVTVVDDRSTDGTRDVAARAARDLAGRLHIQLISNAGPPGPSAARNTAIRASKAEWIALCDADDLLLPDHHVTLAALARIPGTIFAFGDCCLFDSDTRRVVLASHHEKSGLSREPAETLPSGGFTLGERMFGAMLRGGMIGTSATLFRRDAAIAAGLFDETMMYCEDAHLFLRLAAAGTFVFTRQRLAEKRVHDGNLSHSRNTLPWRHAQALTVAKLLGHVASPAHPARLPLAPLHRTALDVTLPRALNGYLYEASRTGLRAFLDAAYLCRQSGRAGLAMQPRHLMRLLLRGILQRGRASAQAVT